MGCCAHGGNTGAYAFTVPSGCYVLELTPPSSTATAVPTSRSLCLDDGQSLTNVNAIIDAGIVGSISGLVTELGQPVPEVVVSIAARGSGREEWQATTTTAADGSYTIQAPPGCWLVTFIAPEGQTFDNGEPERTIRQCLSAGEDSPGNDAVLRPKPTGGPGFVDTVDSGDAVDTGPSGAVDGVATGSFLLGGEVEPDAARVTVTVDGDVVEAAILGDRWEQEVVPVASGSFDFVVTA